VLWYKRLEAVVFKLPRVAPGAGSVALRASELAMLLDGIDIAKLKGVMSDRRRIDRRIAKAPRPEETYPFSLPSTYEVAEIGSNSFESSESASQQLSPGRSQATI
jgi:hypothetical protein